MWFTRYRARARGGLALFCFPHAGSGPSVYCNWSDELAPFVEVVGVQLPGRESRFRELPIAKLPDLVAKLRGAIQPELDRPFALFGNSVGALVAFELVHSLRESGGPEPEHLFVAAAAAPHMPPRLPRIDRLPGPELVAKLREIYDGIPEAILADPEFLTSLLPSIRADLALKADYEFVARPPLRCPITAFGGRGDGTVTADELDSWRQMTTGPFESRVVSGQHLFLQSARETLLGCIRSSLARQVEWSAAGGRA